MAEQERPLWMLRLFGVEQKKLAQVLKKLRADGCPGLRLMERDGEYLVCFDTPEGEPEAAKKRCEAWRQTLRKAFGDSIFSEGESGLAQAALDALLAKRRLLIAGDLATCQLLNQVLAPLGYAKTVYDFGQQTVARRQGITRLREGGALQEEKELSPSERSRRMQKALHMMRTDLAVLCRPGDYILLCSPKRSWIYAAKETESRAKLINRMLDMVRRAARGLPPGDGVQVFHPMERSSVELVPESPGQRPDLMAAAAALYEDPAPLAAGAAAPRRSKRKKKQARARLVLAGCLLLLLLLAGGLLLRSLLGPGRPPKSQGYGTADFDAAAQEYLLNAAASRQTLAWLALPGAEGALVYPQQQGEGAWLTAGSLTGACANGVLAGLDGVLTEQDPLTLLEENPGFTLYTGEEILRYQTAAVYYFDPADPLCAFDPAAWEGLGHYGDYAAFVTGIRARSLYDTGVQIGETDSFVTLLLGQDETGATLALTGRLLGQDEQVNLFAKRFEACAAPLHTQAQYQAQDQIAPDAAAVQAVWADWFLTRDEVVETAAPAAEESSGEQQEDLDAQVSALSAQTASLLASTDALLQGLTDLAGTANAVEDAVDQGASGELSGTDATVDDAVAGEETATVTGGDATGRVIEVTMNGVQQSMDLTQCLAMIVQNELGNNQPVEAYKAQAVAAHSWILNQGYYPSVSGVEPSGTVYDAVSQVATVLVTYEGTVCFTPYCASVSTGTVSCMDVWGTDRAYLQAVESPYDQQYSAHWNTNGQTSGTARFARQTVLDRVRDTLGIDLSGIDPSQWFTVLSTNPYGYVTQMQIGNDQSGSTTCSGRWFRENLLLGCSVDGRTLRSCAFTWSYDQGLDCFIFDVYGYGHGVGMSQWGAIGYAYSGWSYEQILTHYYVGTTLVSY